MSIENFDIKSYLEYKGIQFWEKGKNVQKGWINVTCQFCGDHHYSGNNHLGINIKSKMLNCWICGPHGSINAYIQKIENCTWAQTKAVVSSFQDIYGNMDINRRLTPRKHGKSSIMMPKEFTTEFSNLHLNYLIRRNFNPNEIIPKYQLMACNNLGKYKFRIIIPIIMNSKIVSFTSRSIVEKRWPKYKHLNDDEAAIPIKNCIYNIDNVKNKVIITEGPTDVWRIGDDSVAMLGKIFPDTRINLLHKLKLKAAFIMFDGEQEAIARAYKLADKLSIFIEHVEVIELSGIDPAELSVEETKKLKKNLF